MSAQNIQDTVLALGGTPVDPTVPGSARIDEALRRMEAVMATEAYAALALRRRNGEISAEEFKESFDRLLMEVE